MSLVLTLILAIAVAANESAAVRQPATQPVTQPATQPATQPIPVNLIINGDFETPKAEDRHLALSGDQLDGWKIERGDVDVVSTYWPAAHGEQSLDLNGYERGVISQTIDTEPGNWYRLTFFYAGNPDKNAANGDRAAEVQWGQQLLSVLHPRLGSLGEMNWRRQEFVVQAKTAKTTLLFISLTDGAYGVTLDDVSLLNCEPPDNKEK